ncbi:thiolase C-terminal domain-containing protein [Streptomyces sp. WM6386]|uniref:thiolase C-terminal domain-containing protein n=1 Tax=Streptomyces sp. WM6386 TaxID=1415558 RepID=UPI000619E7AA|nr:ditF protein [Streptomyces sp. WM6386]KKD06644.1 DitF protein [Streptomyces sp. WM6386]
MAERAEDRALISGVGQSEVGRRLGRSDLDLTREACHRALADAGLTVGDIDGLVAWPGEWPAAPGFCGPALGRVKDALGLELSWHAGVQDGPSQLAAVMSAVMAVASGYARHVLVYRTTSEATGQAGGGRDTTSPADVTGVIGLQEWLRPFGAVTAAHWLAMVAQRYLHETGATREQIGGLAVSTRRWAGLNPAAVYREPLTIEDYLAARMITTPLCLYDCDVPADGSVAVIVSAAETKADLRSPVRIEAMGSALGARPFWDQWADPLDLPQRDAAHHLWSRTELRPGDVDVAQLYDGFSILTLVWLEAAGFCGRGEGAAFVADGKRIGPGGELPLNTGGGQLSGGRLHGYGLFHEAVVQLRGGLGERQVEGAETAFVGAGGGPLGGCFLLAH